MRYDTLIVITAFLVGIAGTVIVELALGVL